MRFKDMDFDVIQALLACTQQSTYWLKYSLSILLPITQYHVICIKAAFNTYLHHFQAFGSFIKNTLGSKSRSFLKHAANFRGM